MNRKRSFGVALGIVLLTLLLAASVAPAKTTSFQGQWESIDTPTDNSYQWLNVSGGGADRQLHIVFSDTGTSGFGVDPETGEPLYAGLGVGVGEVDGNQLNVVLKFYRCLGPPKIVAEYVEFVVEYDSASDTLTALGVVWNRR